MALDVWGLEIVKGKEIGKVFPVAAGSSILGGGINGEPGIDLATQEGSSLRKMAPRQARLDRGAEGLSLADLDSPGGTFVNRQRLLSGQSRKLEVGDILQLGGVQLKVVKGSAAPAAPPPTVAASTVMTTPYPLSDGSVCKTWDDFLTASSRSWTALRTELTSGKLDQFLRFNGHGQFLAPTAASMSADERLDAWLGSLPTTRPSLPEIDIHPTSFRVKATPGGGLTRIKLQVTNVGYRLLRSTIAIEPGSKTLRLDPEWTSKPFVTSEQTEIPIDVEIPESVKSPVLAFIKIESNGGNRRVEVRIEPVTAVKVSANGSDESTAAGGPEIREALSRWSLVRRIWIFGLVGFGLRMGLAIFDSASLVAPLIAMGGLFSILGAWFGLKRGGPQDLFATTFAAGVAGVFVGALLHALRGFVAIGTSSLVQGLLWAGIGVLVAILSGMIVPPIAASPSKEPS